ncbi:MAG: hypothetical protein LUG99_15020 [Lachnospiraceae bacterium]|nr:hypothetical protein [Lachnospiraceae bacterium]
MKKTKEKLMIINIENDQSFYASCLQIINNCESGILCDEQGDNGSELFDQHRVLTSENMPAGAVRWIEEPIQLRGQSWETAKESFYAWQRQRQEMTMEDFTRLCSENVLLHYHIRIHLDWDLAEMHASQLLQLQYLALLLRKLDSVLHYKIKRKLSIFLFPNVEDMYPFSSRSDGILDEFQMVVSQYLRMIAKKYTGTLYCAVKETAKVEVKALDLVKSLGMENYFPIIYINGSIYDRIFSETKDITYYERLFKSKKEFGSSAERDIAQAIPDFIAKTSYEKIEKAFHKFHEEILSLCRKSGGLPIMRFCLFAFLLNDRDELQQTWKLAIDIENGIRQIVQNSVQYSQFHECVFSFYLHEDGADLEQGYLTDYLAENYPGAELNSDSERRAALEILITDLNETQDILDSFKDNLKKDTEIYPAEVGGAFDGHYGLIEQFDRVNIRNLFSEFNESDLKREWARFRGQDIVAHVGLSLFAITAERFRASLRVISCKKYWPQNKNLFYKCFNENDISGSPWKLRQMIPGTQFSILLPIGLPRVTGEHSLGQMDVQKYIREDYQCFADYFDYKEQPIEIAQEDIRKLIREVRSRGNGGGMSSYDIKNESVIRWFHFWNEFLINQCRNPEFTVYNCDLSKVLCAEYFSGSDMSEVCIKGLIIALGRIDGFDMGLHIALTNLPSGYIDRFCDIAVLIGTHSFPNNVQLYFQEHSDGTVPRELVFVGSNFTQAICKSYLLSIEHGSIGCSFEAYQKAIKLYSKSSPEEMDFWIDGQDKPTICPFDAIIKVSGNQEETLFERQIHNMAERELDGKSTGYKLSQTHMRLGSKVHIESFYEMSFLFYRTSVANRIAFLILRNLKNESDENFDFEKDGIIFYGYTSYSKAILTSLSEILRILRGSEEYCKLISIASYQHNLQSGSHDIEMYFELEEDCMGEVSDANMLELKVNAKVVQIVPISSTLMTFARMWNEFTRHTPGSNQGGEVKLYRNYTLFWVLDQKNKENGLNPSQTEEKYWSEVQGRIIHTNFSDLEMGGCKDVHYFMYSPVIWNDPLRCNLCFPQKVIDEIPLVETDATSTVPAIQIRYMSNEHSVHTDSDMFQKNIERIKKLWGCVLQGHIVRRKNHYQYYIDTQRYFRNVRDEISTWLREEVPGREKAGQRDFPVLQIIFSPEHNTNVGFAQYVNTYYFGGLAEIVSINVDKEFRSNFVCEHAALMNVIEYLHKAGEDNSQKRVHFYFVDDSIITGETFEKANSFLHSLIPADVKHIYSANLFDKVFLLVDRLSKDTKRVYVENMEENFHSFVHVDVSNMRTHGNSCVVCRLRHTVEKMFKCSATKHQAEHWAKKMDDYKEVQYDDLQSLRMIDRDKSYHRITIYHMLQNTIIKNGQAYTVGNAYDVLLDLMEWFLSGGAKGNIHGYRDLFSGLEGADSVNHILKVISRPFFSYDYKIRLQVQTLYIFLTESFMGNVRENMGSFDESAQNAKSFLYEADRVARTDCLVQSIKKNLPSASSELRFVEEYLMEGLSELGSTYFMRKQTLKKAYDYVSGMYVSEKITDRDSNRFWETYVLNIHWILANTKDEAKEFWLEYLYAFGEEYPKTGNAGVMKSGAALSELPRIYTEITQNTKDSISIPGFRRFILELFLQNTGIKFKGAKKQSALAQSMESVQVRDSGVPGNISDAYFLDSWNDLQRIEQSMPDRGQNCNREISMAESRLFVYLKNKKDSGAQKDNRIADWYRGLLDLLTKLAECKYGIRQTDIEKFLITDNSYVDSSGKRVSDLNITSEQREADNYFRQAARYQAKHRLESVLALQHDSASLLEETGYYIYDQGQEAYFILFFDNPQSSNKVLVKRGLNLARVFLYMGFKNQTGQPMGIRYMAREILTYRYRLLKILGQDFNGDTFSNYAKSNDERNILSHEKAASHSASTDDEIVTELFDREVINNVKDNNVYKLLNEDDKTRWLLIRNYTNNQIARLFNRSFRNEEIGEIPPLYLKSFMTGSKKGTFGQKLQRLSDLNITDAKGKQDRRFEIISQVMNINLMVDENAVFVSNAEGLFYNQEYFRCILVDIMISAIKYQSSEKQDFLLRIEELMLRNKYRRGKRAEICLYRQQSDDFDVDYLVIENRVYGWAHDIGDCNEKNRQIEMRLADPLDFIDGHMSMLTTKRYIENLKAVDEKCRFYYQQETTENSEEKLVFKSCLPVLLRKESNG